MFLIGLPTPPLEAPAVVMVTAAPPAGVDVDKGLNAGLWLGDADSRSLLLRLRWSVSDMDMMAGLMRSFSDVGDDGAMGAVPALFRKKLRTRCVGLKLLLLLLLGAVVEDGVVVAALRIGLGLAARTAAVCSFMSAEDMWKKCCGCCCCPWAVQTPVQAQRGGGGSSPVSSAARRIGGREREVDGARVDKRQPTRKRGSR